MTQKAPKPAALAAATFVGNSSHMPGFLDLAPRLETAILKGGHPVVEKHRLVEQMLQQFDPEVSGAKQAGWATFKTLALILSDRIAGFAWTKQYQFIMLKGALADNLNMLAGLEADPRMPQNDNTSLIAEPIDEDAIGNNDAQPFLMINFIGNGALEALLGHLQTSGCLADDEDDEMEEIDAEQDGQPEIWAAGRQPNPIRLH